MTQDALKSMTAEELLTLHSIYCQRLGDDTFEEEHREPFNNVRAELLRRLQPEGQLPTAIGSHVLYSRGVAHSSSAGTEPGLEDLLKKFIASYAKLNGRELRFATPKYDPYVEGASDFADLLEREFFPASQQVDVRELAEEIGSKVAFALGQEGLQALIAHNGITEIATAVLRKALGSEEREG